MNCDPLDELVRCCGSPQPQPEEVAVKKEVRTKAPEWGSRTLHPCTVEQSRLDELRFRCQKDTGGVHKLSNKQRWYEYRAEADQIFFTSQERKYIMSMVRMWKTTPPDKRKHETCNRCGSKRAIVVAMKETAPSRKNSVRSVIRSELTVCPVCHEEYWIDLGI